MSERVVLAYSGGLDTSVAIGWIAEKTGAEVIAVAADVGQGGEDMEAIRQRALGCGAVESLVLDLRDEFAEEYCLPALQANALYLDRYPLVARRYKAQLYTASAFEPCRDRRHAIERTNQDRDRRPAQSIGE